MAPYVSCCIEGSDDGVPFLALSIANGTGRENWISVALAWLAEGEELGGSNVLHAAAESAAYSQELGGLAERLFLSTASLFLSKRTA